MRWWPVLSCWSQFRRPLAHRRENTALRLQRRHTPTAVILPPLSLDLGLLLISIGVVNLWRMRENAS